MKYHEKETIRLSATEPQSRRILHAFLINRGFKVDDDSYFLLRPDLPMPWQGISVISVEISYKGVALYGTEGMRDEATSLWDELEIEFLLGCLPREFISKCALECETLAEQFDLVINFGGKALLPGKLQQALDDIADVITAEWDEPGSELLGILIQQNYGR